MAAALTEWLDRVSVDSEDLALVMWALESELESQARASDRADLANAVARLRKLSLTLLCELVPPCGAGDVVRLFVTNERRAWRLLRTGAASARCVATPRRHAATRTLATV